MTTLDAHWGTDHTLTVTATDVAGDPLTGADVEVTVTEADGTDVDVDGVSFPIVGAEIGGGVYEAALGAAIFSQSQQRDMFAVVVVTNAGSQRTVRALLRQDDDQ